MDDGDRGMDKDDTGLADAVAVARKLLARLADELEVRDSETARSAITTLRDTRDVLARLAPPLAAKPTTQANDQSVQGPTIVLDVSDLIGYFTNNRLPTGIQRVQTELIFNILKFVDSRERQLCCFIEGRDEWVMVDSALFMDICIQSRNGGDPLEPRWLGAVRDMRTATDASPALIFPQGAVLVNVGTSWWLPNYFLYVRQAKIAFGVRYVPLIYDLIPVLMPENCDLELVQEFIGWFIGVLEHADFYLAISDATKKDLIALAEKLGRPIAPERIAVAQLDADFRAAGTQVLSPKRLFDEPFVLFVSTIEARKNQLGALDAWAALIAKHGSRKIPRLVLVGKRGFKSDLVLDRLKINADLRERVTILSGIEDTELQALYRDCLFTLYPSFYEGWGLPVTESLCYGKVPLIADNSSLPEAGGSSALYFRTGSTVGMVEILERLILEDRFRRKREEIIRDGFHPRTWMDVATGALKHIRGWIAMEPALEWQTPVAYRNTYYPLVRHQSSRVWPGMGSAETFRHGLGWFQIENQGCWTKLSGAELRMRLTHPGARRLGLELICPPRIEARYRLEIVGRGISITGSINDAQVKWAFLDFLEDITDTEITVRLTTTILSQPELGWDKDFRRLGVGLKGFFLFGGDLASQIGFVEAAALGTLPDLSFYRDRSMTPTEHDKQTGTIISHL